MRDDFEALFKQRDWLYGLARSLAADDHAAQDLVQDTWLAALTNPARRIKRPQSWLKAVAARIAAKRVEKRSPDVVEHLHGLTTREPQPESVAIRVEAGDALWRAVASLDAADRNPVLLHHKGGLSTAEVAQALDITPRAVRQRLAESYEKIRLRLGGEKGARGGAWVQAIGPLLAPDARQRAVGSTRIGSGVLVAGTVAVLVVGAGTLFGTGVLSRADLRSRGQLERGNTADSGPDAESGLPTDSPTRRLPVGQPRVEQPATPSTQDQPQLGDGPKGPLHVSGEVLVDGAVPDGFEAAILYRGPTAVEWSDSQKMDVRDDGTFDVWAHEPGDWSLHLKKPGRSSVDGQPHFARAIQFSATTTEFEVRVIIPETRTVTVLAEGHERVSLKRPEEPTDEWRYGGSCAVVDGKATFFQVPVGRIQVLAKDNQQVLYEGWVEEDWKNEISIE